MAIRVKISLEILQRINLNMHYDEFPSIAGRGVSDITETSSLIG